MAGGLEYQGIDLKWRKDLPAPISLSDTDRASGSIVLVGEGLEGDIGGA